MLTTGLDIRSGTEGNDTFIGTFDNAATSTSNLGDSIDGGAGVDTVRIVSNQGDTVVPTLTNVENLVLNGGFAEGFDVSGIAGLTSLELEQGATVQVGHTRIDLASGQSLTLDRVTDGDDTGDLMAEGELLIGTAASVTSVSLVLDRVGAQTGATAGNDLDIELDSNLVTTVAINSVGGANNISLTGGGVTTLNVSGAGGVTFQGAPATVTTFNASAATGAVSVNLFGSTGANQTITGGSGNDSFTVDLAQNITLNAGAGNDTVELGNATAANLSSTAGAADSINGGEGTDTLLLTGADADAIDSDAAADRALIAGFERVGITDDMDGDTINLANISGGVNYLQIRHHTSNNAANVNGFTSGGTVEYRSATDSSVAVNIGMTGATGGGTPNDTLNIVLNADIGDQVSPSAAVALLLGVNGINKLNVSATDRDNTNAASDRADGYILTLSNDTSVDTITFTGDREVSYTSTATANNLQTITATGLSGNLIVDVGLFAGSEGLSITGGSGTNTIVGTGLGDVIIGGARADNITGGNGADVMTGGAGADTFVFADGSSGGSPSGTNLDSITDWQRNLDIIDHATSLSLSTNASAFALAGRAALNAEGFATFVDADDTLAERITAVNAALLEGNEADGQVAMFEHGGSTFVFIMNFDATSNLTITATQGVEASDVLIRLTGVTGLSDATISSNNLLLG